DVLLYYPYHSFDTVIDLLKTAAIDPAVTEIKICLYRAAEHSRIVDALLSARRNLKNVTVVVELQARFDEANNIAWANQLTDGGVNVIFGVPGLKVHTKLIAITRKEDGKPRIYTHIGSGNFNEKTAKIYTDFSLLTRNKEIGKDVANVFDFINYTYRRHAYKHLMVSPLTQRSGLVGLIENEISNAKLGKPAEIIIKCNNLTDKQIIAQLYEASKVGVSVRIICRGMTSIVPGIKSVSEN
ncbi:phospholipase D-like domain-containing protein, partial [Oleiphilus sp. HI0066]|uniref:phospholipase D-like domain-containing protein n=3 Tax=Oleiphilus TaxID=141450 RepID=UPI000AC2A5DA